MSIQQILQIIIFRVIAQLRAEASRYFLGVLWWIIEPIIYMAVFYVLFEVGLRGGGQEDFIVFLLIGLVFWKWFSSSLMTGSNSLVTNKGIINQINTPKWMFPAISFGIATFKFFITLAILMPFLLIYGITWQVSIIVLPIVIVIQAALALGGAIFLASVVPFLPDLTHIISNGLLFLFFLSGIFFEVSAFPEKVQKWLYLNPMLSMIEAARNVLMYAKWPSYINLLAVLAFSLVMLIFSLWNINRLNYAYAKVSKS